MPIGTVWGLGTWADGAWGDTTWEGASGIPDPAWIVNIDADDWICAVPVDDWIVIT